ncbi:Right handed beta helix region [Burkholderia sp. GAS332]|nr:Right handed beta helix region [Burkholderia sp. GAS332]
MRKAFIILSTALMILCAEYANAFKLYVAPDGSNLASGRSLNIGSSNGPLADLGEAVRRVIAFRRKPGFSSTPIAIAIVDGVYRVSSPIVIPAGASGSPNAPLCIYAIHPGTVWISGGKPLAGFRTLRPGEAGELTGASRIAVRVLDLSGSGLVLHDLERHGWGAEPEVANTELYFNGERMPLARWPKSDYAHIAAVKGKTGQQFVADQPLPAGFILGRGAWAVGYWYYDWSMEALPVTVTDGRTDSFELGGTPAFSMRTGQRFFIQNVLSQLVSPRDWVLDAANQRIYFWPPSSDLSHAEVSDAETLLRIEGASHIDLTGLNFKLARGPAIVIRDSQSVQIRNAEIRGIGGRAIDATGKNIEVAGNRIHDVGDGGVYLSGGDRKTLTPGNLVAKDNDIYDFNLWNTTYRPGIRLAGVGNVAERNRIYDAPHVAIMIDGNDNVVRFNDIHDVVKSTSDAGAIYLGRDWTERGNAIVGNFLHNVGEGSSDARGVYLDDMVSGTTVQRNVFYKVPNAVYVGGGRDTAVEENLFVDSVPPISIDDRGLTWQADAVTDPKGQLRMALHAVPYQGDAYGKYPNLRNILVDDVGAPKYNELSNNLMIRSGCVVLSGPGFLNKRFLPKSTENVCVDRTDVFQFSERRPRLKDFDLPAAFRPRPPAFDALPPRHAGPRTDEGACATNP